MTELPHNDRRSAEATDDDVPTPRWVKAFGMVALLLLVVFAALHLAGGGFGHRIAEHMR